MITLNLSTPSSVPGETEVSELDLTLVVDENVAALDVPVEEVPVVTVGQPLHDLAHDGAVELSGEGHQAGVQESHKIMFHEVKDEIK